MKAECVKTTMQGRGYQVNPAMDSIELTPTGVAHLVDVQESFVAKNA
jgi:hypothetical protein